MIYFTSDHHFGHRNIIEYEERGFATTPAMDQFMIDKWNSIVKHEDTVFHLGDVALTAAKRRQEIVQQLNGHKIVIWGNHDPGLNALRTSGFNEAYRWLELDVARGHKADKVLLIHDYDRYEAYWRLSQGELKDIPYDLIICGHVHSNWKIKGLACNVGVDVWDYRPVSLLEIYRALGRPLNKHGVTKSGYPRSSSLEAFRDLFPGFSGNFKAFRGHCHPGEV